MNLIGTQEAAERLGVTRRRVLAMIQSGKLKADRVAKVWLIDPADLEAVRNRPPGRPRKGEGGKR